MKTKTSKPQQTDLEYEVIFSELLEGVNQGWSRGDTFGFLIGKRIDDAELIAWLHRFGENLQATPEQHQELARRMVLLGEVYGKELGKVAGEIGQRLLAQVPQLDDVPSGEVIEADVTTDDAEVWLEQGKQQFEKVNFQDAIPSYDKALAIQPDLHQAWYNRGGALFFLGRFEEALASFDKALLIQPDFHLVWIIRGLALHNLGRFEEALASFDKALLIQPDFPETWNFRGEVLDNLGRFEEVLTSCDKALAIKPDFSEALYGRGVALGNLGRFEEALASFDKALAIQPDFLRAWNNRGLALYDLGRMEEALASFDKALLIQPDLHDAWINRGNVLDKLGRFEEAIASFDKALLIQPDLHDAWYNRGNALGKVGRFEEAIASFDKALLIQPDLHQAWNSRGLALHNLGRFEEAIASYDKVLAIQPDEHYAWYNRGNALGKVGRFEEAVASYDKALAIQPDFPHAWNNRGTIFCNELNQFEEALASFDKALAIQPDFHETWKNPNFHETWKNRGVALGKLRRIEEAIASYDKALAIQPDYHEAWINRGIAAGISLHYDSQAATILKMQFPRSPTVIPNPTLNQRGYEGMLLSFQEGLKHCPQETHPEGWGELNHAIGYAHYIQRKNSEAVTSYNQALKTLTSDAFPELHLEVLQDLIKALLGLKRTPEAEQLKRDGTDLLRRLAKSKSQEKKEELAFKFVSFQQLTVDIAIQSGQIIEALETAEEGKNACLTWLLSAYSDEIASPKYAEIQQLLQPTTAIVYWHLSPAALTTFILKHGETPKTLETPETDFLNRLEKFEKWVKDWNQQYTDYGKGKKSETEQTSNWRDNLPEKLQQLSEILHIPEIETTLTGITHLNLIPHRDLHRFPLHALFADKFTITYLPSAEIGRMTQGKNPEKQHKLFSVEHPNSEGFEDLPYAEIQSTAISQLFENPHRLSDNAATAQAIKTALASPYTIFHFTGHGTYNFFQPKKSYLALSRKDTLTLEEIFQIPLHPFRLVCLAACETAITGNQSITTEYIGLVSGFLSRRVTYVVSTLWTVESEASALIMMKFYQLLQQGEPEPVALKTAQKWLRQATWRDIQSFYAQTLASLPAEADNLRLLLEDALNRANTMEVDQHPFTHPYHWSAFTITGQA